MKQNKTKVSSTKSTTAKKKSVKPLYNASTLTKKSNSKLWVAFASGKTPETGLVYSSTLSRDTVRNVTAKSLGLPMSSVRARRVGNMSVRKLSNK